MTVLLITHGLKISTCSKKGYQTLRLVDLILLSFVIFWEGKTLQRTSVLRYLPLQLTHHVAREIASEAVLFLPSGISKG